MNMKQIWITCLVIGISLATGCKDDSPDNTIQKAEYVYRNVTAEDLIMELHNRSKNSSLTYSLPKGDSITFVITGTPGAFPFSENEIENRTADSVVFRFDTGVCISYELNRSSGTFGGEGVFDLTNYENYSQELVNQARYRLEYLIDEDDYSAAESCN